ncbi:MAG: hypothetical protein JXR80_11850, partial [Deltaproteobacteria bacterium]|nr:hypothetical protein [Deltaproteobacteria bacterium]
AEIKELESIATVEADYRYQSLVTIEEMSRVSSAADYGNVGALRPGAFESGYLEGGLPGLGLIDSPAFRPDSRPASRPDFQKDQIQDLIDRMAEVIKEWEAEKKLKPEQFIRPLEKLFADHLEKLKDNPQAHARQELFRELGDGLLDQVRNMTTGSVLDITPSQDNIV